MENVNLDEFLSDDDHDVSIFGSEIDSASVNTEIIMPQTKVKNHFADSILNRGVASNKQNSMTKVVLKCEGQDVCIDYSLAVNGMPLIKNISKPISGQVFTIG